MASRSQYSTVQLSIFINRLLSLSISPSSSLQPLHHWFYLIISPPQHVMIRKLCSSLSDITPQPPSSVEIIWQSLESNGISITIFHRSIINIYKSVAVPINISVILSPASPPLILPHHFSTATCNDTQIVFLIIWYHTATTIISWNNFYSHPFQHTHSHLYQFPHRIINPYQLHPSTKNKFHPPQALSA